MANNAAIPNARLALIQKITDSESRLRNLKVRYNADALISRLPNEILLMVFALLPRPTETYLFISSDKCRIWISVTYVCSQWRQVAIAHPGLWTTFLISNRTWSTLFLERSRNLPAYLDVMSNVDFLVVGARAPSPVPESLRVALKKRRHFHIVKISLPNIPGTYLDPFVQSRAPELESLSLAQTEHEAAPMLLPDEIFRGHFPKLHVLRLDRIYLAWGKSPLLCSKLIDLDIRHIERSDRFSATGLIEVLRHLPLLRRLVLRHALPRIRSPGFMIKRDSPVVSLPCLSTLWIEGSIPECLSVLYAVRIPRSAFLHVCFVQDAIESLLDQVDDIVSCMGHLFDGNRKDQPSLVPFEWVSISEEQYCAMLRIKASHQEPPAPKELLLEFYYPGGSSVFDILSAYQQVTRKLLALPPFSPARTLEFRCYQGTPTGYLTWETWLAFSKSVCPETLVIYSTRFLRGFLDVYGDHANGWMSKFHEPGNGGSNGFAIVRTLQLSRVNFRHDDHVYDGRLFRKFLGALQLRLSTESLRKLVVRECKLTQGQVEQLKGLDLEFEWDGRMDGRAKQELSDARESADEESDFDSSDSDEDNSDEDGDDGGPTGGVGDEVGSDDGDDEEEDEEEDEDGVMSCTDSEISATASDMSAPYT